jgi:hypothetical protein
LRGRNKLYDSRIGIGIGDVETLHPEQISLSTGSAFTLSGRELDALGGAPGFAIGLRPGLEQQLDCLRPLAGLCSALVDHATRRECVYVAAMLGHAPAARKWIAGELRVSPQALSQGLNGAGFPALQQGLEWVEKQRYEAPSRPAPKSA